LYQFHNYILSFGFNRLIVVLIESFQFHLRFNQSFGHATDGNGAKGAENKGLLKVLHFARG